LRYRTGNTLIDLDAREIRRGDAVVDVEAKVFDLIALLLAHRDRAVDKRELNAALWGDRPVTDAALSQQLRKARRALGDDGDAQRVIRTVHGRGLRWVGPLVEAIQPPAPIQSQPQAVVSRNVTASRARPWALAATAALLLGVLAAAGWRLAQWPSHARVLAGVRIAVLPTDDQSGDASLDWTRNGLMGLMASLSGQSGGVDVVAAPDVLAIDAGTRPLDANSAQSLRAALGVTHVLATRLRRVGPLYELDLHLIAAGAAERQETLHGSAPAPLAVDAVAQMRRWLGLDPLPDVRNRGIGNPFLSEAYARGLAAQLHGDLAGARKYFEICLDQDPGLAWARLGLAITQGATGDAAASTDNAAKVAAAAREQGNEELLVAALRELGSNAFRRGDLDEAARHLDAALADVSANRPLMLVDLLVADASIEDERGHFQRSRAQFDRALAVARESGNRRGEALVLVNLASLENGAGDAAAAASMLRAGLDAARAAGDASIEGNTLANLGAAEANQGHLLDAAVLLRQALAIARRRGDLQLEMLTSVQLIWVLAPFGRDTEIENLAKQVSAASEREHNPYWKAELDWAIGSLAARRGDRTAALAHFENARGRYRDAGMTRNLAPLLADIVEAATANLDAARAHEAASAFRAIAEADVRAWGAWLPLIDAQLRRVDGDASGALAALEARLDRAPDATGAAAQASLFQLGRWQVANGQPEDLLLRSAWQPWLEQHPDAIALRVAALHASGRDADAAIEQTRLDRLKQAPQLDPDAERQ